MFVQTGTQLTWTGYFDEFSFYNQTAPDCVNAVGANLKNKYNLIVTGVAMDQGTDAISAGSITLNLRSDMDRGNGSDGVADIQSNVEDEFALQGNAVVSSDINVTGSVPATSSSGDNYDDCTGIGDRIRNALPTWLGGTPVTESQQACYNSKNVAQIQSVATNAANNYGATSTTAQVAQTTANAQSKLSTQDTAALADQARKDAAASDNRNLLIWGGVAAGIVVLVLVVKFA